MGRCSQGEADEARGKGSGGEERGEREGNERLTEMDGGAGRGGGVGEMRLGGSWVKERERIF